METQVEKRSRQRRVSLGRFWIFFFVFVSSFPFTAQSAELFDTYSICSRPRFFVFADFSKDANRVRFWEQKNSFLEAVVQKSKACQTSLDFNSRRLRPRIEGRGEILQGSLGSWAIEVQPNQPRLEAVFEDVRNSDCMLRVSFDLKWTISDKGLEPRVIFSSAKHNIAGREIFIEENFLVRGVKFRVEALAGIKFLRFSESTFFSPVINASIRASLPLLYNLWGDFEVSQSLKSFPQELSFSRWEARAGKEFFIPWKDAFILSPYFVLSRDFLLTEQSISIPDGGDNILTFGLGVETSLEFGDYWTLNGHLFSSLVSSNSSAVVEWRHHFVEMALGYRFSSQFRVFAGAGFRLLTSTSGEKMWGGEAGVKVEMEF